MVPSPRGGIKNRWLNWTLLFLYSTSLATADEVLSGSDPPLSASRNAQTHAGRSPAEIPLLNHDIPTPKFRNTNEEVERYQALAPASQKPAVRAPSTQSAESQSLSSLGQARLLSEWEADDIILLSTIDGSLHARDRRTGRERWTLEIEDSPMIEAVHYQQNRSNPDDLLVQDDYVFLIEPSSDGQLYAQFANPQMGLVKLHATVRKMATEVPSFMTLNGQHLATTSSQESKAYTIDAQTGQILNEFPRSKTAIRPDIQPRCRPRSGLDFEDSACKPERTIRLGRNTYVFTISNEDTGHALCTIRFSEWVTNKMDHDLQSQHLSSLDEYDVRTFHNGRVVGMDTTAEQERQHRYNYWLDTPVARVFDVARKPNLEDDTTDLVLLSRSADYFSAFGPQFLSHDVNSNQRVFVNRTLRGHWYAMSESSYPGVTTMAPLSAVEMDKQSNYYRGPLDLHGDLKDIIGVHQLSDLRPQQTLSLPASDNKPDLIPEPEKTMSQIPSPSTILYLSEKLWTLLLAFICSSTLSYACWHYLPKKAILPVEPSIHLQAVELPGSDAPKVETQADDEKSGVLIAETSLDAMVEPISSAVDISTPSHSRVHSLASSMASPRKTKSQENEDSDSDDDDGPNTDPAPGQEERKKKKTKRGVRGGRRNKKRGDITTFEPKPIVSQEKHLKDGMVQVGRLTYDSRLESCLGQGSSGTAVFPGTFDGRCVAVKRLVKTANSLAEKEIRHLVSSDEHPNVIRYHGKEESPSFFYIALDRFDTSLDQFVEYHQKYPTLVSPTRGYDVKDALRQITRGVQHLHSLKLVHRDIKPQNILVRPVKSNRPMPDGQLTPLLFVISDFGLCKPLEDGPESVFAATRTAAGTTGWKAPELLVSSRDAIAAPIVTDSNQSHSQSLSKSTTTSSDGTTIDPPTGRRATKAIDIFSLGCVFFYVLTRGGHPFDKGGSPLARDLNIKEAQSDTSLLRDSFIGYDYDADDLIMQMIIHNPKLRPDTAGILSHPYFWKVEHKLDFVCAVSDAYEDCKQKITNIHDENAIRTETEKEYLAEIAALQAKAVFVIGTKKSDGTLQDFLQALPKSFLTEMGKQRKYTGTKMIDLLRVIRNKKNHFHDLPGEVKDMMLHAPDGASRGQIEGYYSFWRDRFPSLLVNCHQLVQERGLVEQFGLERYYDGSLL